MTKRNIALKIITLLCVPLSANAKEVVQIEMVVAECLNLVHNAKPSDIGILSNFTDFDAYYDSANGKVMTNATTVGDQKPLFVFHKCLNEHGLMKK